VKILIGIVFIAVVFSLGSAMFHMSSKNHDPAAMNRALAWRVGLSALLIGLLLVSWQLGVLE